MIPMLYAPAATSFDTLGIGELSEATECVVTEERNGAFTLKMKIPASANYANQVNVGSLIVADASPAQSRQAFEVVSVRKSLDGIITVSANHISYRLKYSVLKPLEVDGITAMIDWLNTSTHYINRISINGTVFTFESEGISSSSKIKFVGYMPVRSVLGGVEGSMLDVFGGVWKWNNFVSKLSAGRGTDNGVRILYGKNLTGITAQYDGMDAITGLYPYYTKDNVVTRAGTQIYWSGNQGLYAYSKVISKDFADRFEDTPTAAQLESAAQAWINGKGLPLVNLRTSFIPLHQTVEYKDLANVESVEIDDTIHVYVPTVDVDVKAKVIKTNYNVLLDRYDSVEVGNFRTSITEAIKAVTGETA